MLHRLVWWRVLQFDLLWQSETRCRPKQLKHSCLVWLFSYTDASFHILDHQLNNAYLYKMHMWGFLRVKFGAPFGFYNWILTGCSNLHWVLYPLYLFQSLTFQVPWTNCFSVIQVSNWKNHVPLLHFWSFFLSLQGQEEIHNCLNCVWPNTLVLKISFHLVVERLFFGAGKSKRFDR